MRARVEIVDVLGRNKYLGDESNKKLKVHRLKRSTEKSMSTFQSVVEEEQCNGGPKEKRPLAENEKSISRSNKEQGMDKSIKRWNGVESNSIDICVEARAKACRKTPT